MLKWIRTQIIEMVRIAFSFDVFYHTFIDLTCLACLALMLNIFSLFFESEFGKIWKKTFLWCVCVCLFVVVVSFWRVDCGQIHMFVLCSCIEMTKWMDNGLVYHIIWANNRLSLQNNIVSTNIIYHGRCVCVCTLVVSIKCYVAPIFVPAVLPKLLRSVIQYPTNSVALANIPLWICCTTCFSFIAVREMLATVCFLLSSLYFYSFKYLFN